MKEFHAAHDEKIVRHILDTFRPEDDVLREVRERSDRAGLPAIQVGSMDGLHLEVIARTCGAVKAVEMGTLGGYSGIAILRGLAPGGKLYTFEYEPKHAEVAADKVSYPKYLRWAAANLRVGGVVLGDNTLAFGMLADETFESDDASDGRGPDDGGEVKVSL